MKSSFKHSRAELLFDLGRDAVTQGLMAKWLRCRQEARLFLRGVTPRRTRRAFAFGDLTHRVLDRVYRDFHRRGRRPEPRGVQRLVTVMADEVQQEALKKDRTGGDRMTADMAEDVLTLRTLLPEYFEHWFQDDFTDARWEQPEQVFDVALASGHRLTGKIDGVVVLSKEPWLFETKTSSMVNVGTLLQLLPRDLQTNWYLLALRRILKRMPAGTLYNVIRKPQIKRRATEPPRAWSRRLQRDIRARPDFYFLRLEVPVSQRQLLEFESEVVGHLLEFKKWIREGMPAARYGMPCETKWGVCDMAALCHGSDSSLYTRRKHLYPELVK